MSQRAPVVGRIGRGILSGLGATVVLTIAMTIKVAAGIVPQANAIQALVKVSTLWLGTPPMPWIGWTEHGLIGVFLWGTSFALLEPALPGPSWFRGVPFSVGAWILMMVLLMRPAGAGWFGLDLGVAVPLTMLALHLIYGLALGGYFMGLGMRERERALSHAQPGNEGDRPASGPARVPDKRS